MSYPYPPTGPGEQPPGGQSGGWGAPPPGGYDPSGPGWQHQETMAGGVPMGPPSMQPPGMQPPQMQGPMGPMGPMGQPPMGPPPKKGNGGIVIAAIAGAVLLIGGVLGGAYYAASSGGDGKTKTGTSPAAVGTPGTGGGQPAPGQPGSANGQYKPSYYNATKSWSLWDKLNASSTDSQPMTVTEVFSDAEAKAQTNNIEHITMQLQGSGRLDTDCGSAVWGAGLKTALQGYGCTQAIRAAYVSSDQRWVGQVVIFNLRDVNAANSLIGDMDPQTGNKGFFLPVSGPAPVSGFGKGNTGASGGAYGHFVVIGWAGGADGTASSADTIAPASLVERAAKTFLFTRNVRS